MATTRANVNVPRANKDAMNHKKSAKHDYRIIKKEKTNK